LKNFARVVVLNLGFTLKGLLELIKNTDSWNPIPENLFDLQQIQGIKTML
jgi:hypothetical protein